MKKLILFGALFFSVLVGSLLLSPAKTFAATGEVIDRSTIKVGDQVFFDSDTDDNFNYKEQNPTDDCADTILGFNNNNFKGTNTPSSATLRVGTSALGSTQCNYKEENITFTSASNFLKAFNWVDENTISGSDGKLTFERDGSSSVFVSTKVYKSADGRVSCSDTLSVSSTNKSASLTERKGQQNADHDYDWYPFNPASRKFNDTSQCWEAPVISNILIGGSPEEGNDGAGAGGSASNSTEADDNSCESHGALAWIMCPIIELVSGGLNWADTQTQNLMIVDQGKYTSSDLHRVWINMRNIGSIILVIMMLVMVISSAIGSSFVDPYTVKKALPRMVVAIIFMQLSWYICLFLIDFVNAIGYGVLGLMTAPFRQVEIAPGQVISLSGNLNLAQLFEPSLGGAAVQFGFIGLTIAALTVPGVLGILMTFIAAGLLIMLIAFFTLIARQIVIVTLVLFSPLAILAWVFPGNDKLWKIWWETFIKLLLMFPIVMALIAAGRIFAYVIGNIDSGGAEGGLIGPLLKLTAYVLPYFFIPFAFKAAGGLFGNLVGMVNDRSRGLFDRLKQGRQKGLSSIYQRGTSSGLWEPNSALKRAGNRAVGTMFEPHSYAALYGDKALKRAGFSNNIMSRRASHIMSKIQNAKIEASQKMFQHLNQNDFNDKAYSYLTGVHRFGGKIGSADASGQFVPDLDEKGEAMTTEKAMRAAGIWGRAPQSYEDYIKAADILDKSDDETERIAGRALRSQAGYLTSYINDPELNSANVIAAGAMGWASHGFSSPDDLESVYNTLAFGKKYVTDKDGNESIVETDKGQVLGEGMAGALVSRAQLFGQEGDIDVKLGYGVLRGQNGMAESVYRNPKRAAQMFKTFKQQNFLSTKSGSIRRMLDKGVIFDVATERDENGKFTAAAKAAQDGIMLGASSYSSSDIDAKAAWREAAKQIDAAFPEVKLQKRIGQSDEVMEERERQGMHDRGGHSGGGHGVGPGDSPIPPPPGATPGH